MTLFERIIHFGGSGPEGYVLVTGALWAVAVFTIWRGRHTQLGGALVPLFHTLMIFSLARVAFLDFRPLAGDSAPLREIVFSVLSLASFYFLALVAVRLDSTRGSAGDAPEERESKRADAVPNSLLREMVILGLAVSIPFFAASGANSPVGMILAFANAMLVGATARIAAFTIRRAPRGGRSMGSAILPVVIVATVSWVLYEIVPLVSGDVAVRVLHAARWSDFTALVLLIAGVSGFYVRWGDESDTKAREREAEIETAKVELERLNRMAKDIYEDSNSVMFKQKEQALASMRKTENFEKLLQIGVTIQQRRKLDEVLQMIVELVHSHLRFKTVTLRLLNEKAQSFETRAHTGLGPDILEKVVNYRIPMSEFQKMADPRFRISKSYFIKSSTPWFGEETPGEDSMLVQNTWGDIDMLVVPLFGENNGPIGYLTVETPEDPTLSLSDVIETLEMISTMAVIGIRNAKIAEELREKDKKLVDFTEKLSSLNKMKSNFVATMSHEFRTPLTSIKAYCDTLIKNADSVDRDLLKEFLYVIDEESGRLMTLVEDILDFSQLESGALKFERRPCNLNQIMIGAAAELSKNFELKEVTLREDIPKENVVVHAERDLLRQLVVNLLHNASKFCKAKGNVWMRLEEEVASARIVVEDDGVGIPEDQLDKVFDQFYQVDSSDTREHGGSGLGLALCRSVVEWHEGRIWVQNMNGGGARFVVVLPKRQAVTRSHVMNVSSTVRRLEVEKFLELIVENVSELMSASKVSLMLLDPVSDELRIEAAIGIQEEVVEHSSVKLGEGISGKVAQERKSMLVRDIEKDGRVARSNNEPVYGSKSFLCVPILREDQTMGVLNVSSPVGKREFTEKDCELLEFFAERVAGAIAKIERFMESSRVYENVRDALRAILEAMRFVDARDSRYVTELVSRAAAKLGLAEYTRAALPYVLAVYDLGLSRVGSHILKKPAELSPKERKEIESHPIIGDELLRAIEPDSKIREAVLYHHENYDGSGYPGRLSGQSIPLGARIVRAADSLRALISERPYQRRYTFEEAKEILKHRSGSYFDPEVVEAFVRAMDELTLEQDARIETGNFERVAAPAIEAPEDPGI
jgi:signal transduction histidine kinase/putative methionine-R-sulfoxide reductase with GAF domain